MVIQKQARISQEHFNDATRVAYGLLNRLDDSIIYHRKEHTTDIVVPAALAIAEAEGFALEEKLLVGIFAAFHDTGFIEQYNANEPIGARLLEEYGRLSDYAFSEEQIQWGKDAIENTNMKNPPQTKYAKVLRDADFAVLGHPDFVQWNTDLKEECKLHPESPMHQASLTDAEWGKSQLGFLLSFHNWFTKGARNLYETTKQQNLAKLKAYYQLE